MTLFGNRRKEPHRVAMVVHAYYLRDARVRRYAEALVDQGYEADVFCLRDEGEAPKETHRGVRIIRIPYTRVRGGKLSYCLEYAFSLVMLGFYLSLFQVIRRYSLVHVHTPPDALVLTTLIPRALGAKTILDYHDLMPELYMAKYRIGGENRTVRLLKAIERVSARLADVVLTACGTFRDNLITRSVPERKVNVIRNLPDPKLFQHRRGVFAPDTRNFTLLYIGTISERYGIDLAIRALSSLRVKIPQIRLRIVGKITGEGRDKETLQLLARRHAVDDIVEFCPPVALDAVAGVMGTCDVGVYTPIHDIHMDHAFSLKAGEFAAMGVPMVTTRTPVMEEYLGEKGAAYVESGDVDGFVGQVLRLHSDAGFRASVLRGAEQFTAQNNWNNEKRVYLEIVDRLVGRHCDAEAPAGVRTVTKRVARIVFTTSSRCMTTLFGGGAPRPRGTVRILTYHDICAVPRNDFTVSANDFAEQMRLLADHYPLVSLDDVRAWLAGELDLDDGAIAVTFDDGFEGVHEHAVPCMGRHGIPGAVFVIEESTLNGRTWKGDRTLSPAQLQTMARSGFLVGSHGRSHVSLAAYPLSSEQLNAEIAGSKAGLEQLLGMPVRYFAYPYGTGKDVNSRVVAAVDSAGYDLALTSIHGRIDRAADPLQLRRVKVERTDSLATFRKLLDGGMDQWAWIDTHATWLQSRRRMLVPPFESTHDRT